MKDVLFNRETNSSNFLRFMFGSFFSDKNLSYHDLLRLYQIAKKFNFDDLQKEISIKLEMIFTNKDSLSDDEVFDLAICEAEYNVLKNKSVDDFSRAFKLICSTYKNVMLNNQDNSNILCKKNIALSKIASLMLDHGMYKELLDLLEENEMTTIDCYLDETNLKKYLLYILQNNIQYAIYWIDKFNQDLLNRLRIEIELKRNNTVQLEKVINEIRKSPTPTNLVNIIFNLVKSYPKNITLVESLVKIVNASENTIDQDLFARITLFFEENLQEFPNDFVPSFHIPQYSLEEYLDNLSPEYDPVDREFHLYNCIRIYSNLEDIEQIINGEYAVRVILRRSLDEAIEFVNSSVKEHKYNFIYIARIYINYFKNLADNSISERNFEELVENISEVFRININVFANFKNDHAFSSSKRILLETAINYGIKNSFFSSTKKLFDLISENEKISYINILEKLDI